MQKSYAIQAIDDLQNLGKRSLVFSASPTKAVNTFTQTFDDGRVTLMLDGQVYDWYGHHATLGEGIKRVVEPYGYSSNGLDVFCDSDRFIVELVTGGFAVAGIRYNGIGEGRNDELTITRQIATARRLFVKPTLELTYTHGTYFEKKDDDMLKGSFMEHYDAEFWRSEHARSLPHVLVGYHLADKPGQRLSVIARAYEGHHGPIWNRVFPNKTRQDLLTAKIDDVNRVKFVGENRWSEGGYSTYLIGDLELSPDKQKMSAHFVFPDTDGNTRISTDAEVAWHLKSRWNLSWYYDPEL